MSESNTVRVRFAPSPTGPLHIGGVRTALYNYLFARHAGGTMILRIEDTDSKRYVPGSEAYIVEALQWLNIQIDEGVSQGGDYGPYRQSERKEIYKKYIDQLLEQDKAYLAFDSPEQLEAKRAEDPNFQYDASSRLSMLNSLTLSATEVEERLQGGEDYTVRFKIEPDRSIEVQDMIRGRVVFNSSVLDDKVLYKSADQLPTYHLANVVDDHLMKISHVIRGEEWLPSTPLHVLLYEALGWDKQMPLFAHLPLLLKPDGKGKLSKRDGDRLDFPVFPLNWEDPQSGEISKGYREAGYFPQAVINFLALLGWNPGDNREMFSMDQLIEAFTIERCSKSGAKFDYEKARWFNHQYMQELDNSTLAESLLPLIEAKGYKTSPGFVEAILVHIKEKAAKIIVDHVNNGLKLANQYHLPKVVKDFIATHHGTGPTRYFYTIYKNEHPDQEPPKEAFYYPGPNPFSKETAILMMADTIEAASHSLTEYSESSISDLVEKLIGRQIQEGAYKNVPITFQELEIIKSVFKQKLKSIYHTRIAYPEEKKRAVRNTSDKRTNRK
jgi:glutamyl-tRNA synthetase